VPCGEIAEVACRGFVALSLTGARRVLWAKSEAPIRPLRRQLGQSTAEEMAEAGGSM
jgi:hypothetical protein